MTYKYHVDTLVRLWQRSFFTIEATSQEAADETARSLHEFTGEDDATHVENMWETVEDITIEENKNNPTIEVYRGNGVQIYDNIEGNIEPVPKPKLINS